LFFDQTIVNTLAASVSPYSTEGTNPTTNAADRVYATQTKGQNQVSLAGSVTAGYTGSFSVGLPIAA
jgi:hypothetical protein